MTREKMLEECVTPNEEVFAMCEEHYLRGRLDALEEFRTKINNYLDESTDFADFVVTDNAIDIVIEEMKGGEE